MREIWSRVLWVSLCVGIGLGGSLTAGAHDSHPPKKVKICHVPPGNPTQRQTITVPAQAVPHHLRHGDGIGACPSGCGADPGACDDQNLCTDDVCTESGECVHRPVDCNDGNACTADSCAPATGCVNDPAPANGTSCSDDNVCTDLDVCQNGDCIGSALPGCCTSDADCDDSNACTVDQCIGNACVNGAKNCSLSEVCGIPGFSDPCVVSFCNQSDGSCATTPVDCDDGNICTIDYCDASSGCSSVPTQTGPEEPAELTCNDGLDNDCDGLIDAADPDCPTPCVSPADCGSPPPATCAPTGAGSTLTVFTMVCSAGTCATEQSVESCTDSSCGMCSPGCTPGSQDTQECGFCGVQTRVCDVNGQWSAYGACTGQGECQAGSVDQEPCGGCGDGSITRVCTQSCQWGSFGSCQGGTPPPCP